MVTSIPKIVTKSLKLLATKFLKVETNDPQIVFDFPEVVIQYLERTKLQDFGSVRPPLTWALGL